VFPDSESRFVRHANSRLLHGQQNLAAMIRLVRYEVSEQYKAGPILDVFTALDNSGEASVHCE
jgi:hypothetical protein